MRTFESAKRKWGTQIKTYPVRPAEVFQQAVADGLDMIELRAPTRYGSTVAETDFMSDAQVVQRLRTLGPQYGIELAYHAPQGGEWHFGQHPLETSISRLRECVIRSASIGARIMTLHLGIDVSDRVGSIRNVAAMLQAATPFAEEHGVLLCVENVFLRNSVAGAEDCAFRGRHRRAGPAYAGHGARQHLWQPVRHARPRS